MKKIIPKLSLSPLLIWSTGFTSSGLLRYLLSIGHYVGRSFITYEHHSLDNNGILNKCHLNLLHSKIFNEIIPRY